MPTVKVHGNGRLAPLILTSALGGSGFVASCSSPFTIVETTSITSFLGGRLGIRTELAALKTN